jgi:hypothetical protein
LARKRYYIPDNPDGVIPSRLKRFGRAAQLQYMEAWFREYYEDPADGLDPDDGEFVYPWGGPYDAFDELAGEFGDLVPEERIQELANNLESECVEWAPTPQKQQELGSAADETLAFPMWPSEPRAMGQRAAPGSKAGGTTLIVDSRGVVENEPPRADLSTPAAENVLNPLEAVDLADNADQRPAAYRFWLRDGKIDVLPEPPEPEDREFALDTYHELVAKARELHERLMGTNSAPHVRSGVERLITALGTRFDDIRPGVLLSRSRDIEADRAAFGDELLPDTIAMMDSTAKTLRDLLASFPGVRRIEAEVLALDLDRVADAVPMIREQMAAIKATAEKSEIVTEEAIGALKQNDGAIEDAIDPGVQRRLVADKLLVVGNFARAVIGGIASSSRSALTKAGTELAGMSGDVWKEVRARLPGAVGLTVTVAPLLLLADQISDPYLRIGAAVPALTPIASILKKAILHSLKDALARRAKDEPKGKRGRKKP